MDGSSSSAPRKQEEDCSALVDAALPEAEALAASSQLTAALEKLATVEKKTRSSFDTPSTTRVLVGTIEILKKHAEWALLNEQLKAYARKHGQLREAVKAMVEKAMEYLEELEGDKRRELIDSLREVTEGKIYLEVPRARVTKLLSAIHEQKGELSTASDLLQELQIETFGSMDRKEKCTFILEQMRLLALLKDWDKMAIVGKKINVKWLSEEGYEEIKLTFYGLMIRWGLQGSEYLQVCKFYRSLLTTPSVEKDDEKWPSVLRNIVFFIVLSPWGEEMSDLLHRIAKEEKLPRLAEVHALIKCFITPELMRWPAIESAYGPPLRQTRVFGAAGVPGVTGDIEEEDTPQGEKRWEALHSRIVEHNIRTIAAYYTRLTLVRLAVLLDLTPAETETHLARLVSNGMVSCKIDRPAGVVEFGKRKTREDRMNEWRDGVQKLLSTLEGTTHLIAKEQAVSAALKLGQRGIKA